MDRNISNRLLYYKREDIRQAMAEGANNKEVAVRYGNKGYGKRPGMITTPQDILELVKRGATSFHSSEELWKNPMQISTNLSKKELQELRIGWDLVLDIDCPYWEIAKLTAKLMIKALNDNGVKDSVSIKFSGNKGFHIGVPFEAFPKSIPIDGNQVLIENLFPDAARKVALYIVDYISRKYFDSQGNIRLDGKLEMSIDKIKKLTQKNLDELTTRVCSECKKEVYIKESNNKNEYLCSKCGKVILKETDERFIKCERCGNPYMDKTENKKTSCKCGSNSTELKFNPFSIVEVDTILISSRHLYRMEFSLHEKSGLASVPFNPKKIDKFEKKHANPEIVKVSRYKFLDRTSNNANEAKKLFTEAYDDKPQIKNNIKLIAENKEFEIPSEAIPEELFPPCIKKGLLGMKDGKKRFMFLLTNFLAASGWGIEMIKERVNNWNKINPEPLKEQYITGHLRYIKTHKKNAPPPNCDNNMYYKDLGLCFKSTDFLCQKIRNPLQYAARLNKNKKKLKKSKNKNS